jgi:hypothetical protein
VDRDWHLRHQNVYGVAKGNIGNEAYERGDAVWAIISELEQLAMCPDMAPAPGQHNDLDEGQKRQDVEEQLIREGAYLVAMVDRAGEPRADIVNASDQSEWRHEEEDNEGSYGFCGADLVVGERDGGHEGIVCSRGVRAVADPESE